MLELHACFVRQLGSDHSVRPHRHPQPQWYQCLAGSMALSIDGEVLHAEPGSGIIVSPQRERAVAVQGAANRYLMVRFSCPSLDLSACSDRVITIPQHLNDSVAQLVREITDPQDGHSDLAVRAGMVQVMLGLARAATSPVAPISDDPRADAALVDQVDIWLKAHLDQPLRRPAIAAAMHCSDSHFARRYRRATGIGVNQRLDQLRIERAIELLLETSLAITAIPKAVGLRSHSHFVDRFRQATDMTPAQFRRQGGTVWWQQKPRP